MRFESLCTENWHLFVALFGEKGACGGCWCMNWRLPASAFEKGKGDGNKMALKERVDKGDFVGILAIDGVKAVAWCSVAPRATFPRLEKSKILKPVDDELVWSITCLYLDKSMRGRGFASEMIQAATQEACVRGA